MKPHISPNKMAWEHKSSQAHPLHSNFTAFLITLATGNDGEGPWTNHVDKWEGRTGSRVDQILYQQLLNILLQNVYVNREIKLPWILSTWYEYSPKYHINIFPDCFVFITATQRFFAHTITPFLHCNNFHLRFNSKISVNSSKKLI